MELSNELQYINRIGLKKLIKISVGYNSICPFCDDGKHKRKLYILTKRSFISVICFRCIDPAISFKRFLERANPNLYEEYKAEEKTEYIEKLKAGKILQKKSFKPEPILNTTPIEKYKHDLKYVFKLNEKYFVPASSVEQCILYAKKRKIPPSIFKKMYFSTHKHQPFSNMLIFPLWYDEERVYGFQGRSLDRKMFYNFCNNESFKVYNIFNIDPTKTVYIFESIIDSLYTENSIAGLGTSLSEKVLNIIKNRVWILDNDYRSKYKKGLVEGIKLAKQGEKIFIFPNDIEEKDFNELVTKKEYTSEKLSDMIRDNVYEGLGAIAKLKFKIWSNLL